MSIFFYLRLLFHLYIYCEENRKDRKRIAECFFFALREKCLICVRNYNLLIKKQRNVFVILSV